jgi:hypothetical protein
MASCFERCRFWIWCCRDTIPHSLPRHETPSRFQAKRERTNRSRCGEYRLIVQAGQSVCHEGIVCRIELLTEGNELLIVVGAMAQYALRAARARPCPDGRQPMTDHRLRRSGQGRALPLQLYKVFPKRSPSFLRQLRLNINSVPSRRMTRYSL